MLMNYAYVISHLHQFTTLHRQGAKTIVHEVDHRQASWTSLVYALRVAQSCCIYIMRVFIPLVPCYKQHHCRHVDSGPALQTQVATAYSQDDIGDSAKAKPCMY